MDANTPDPTNPPVDRRRVRYRVAEQHIKDAMSQLDESAGDREIHDLLEFVLKKLAARGTREPR